MKSASLSPAYVIHARPYRESSALVNVFSQQFGKVAVVARGARSKRSPLRALLQPGVPLLMSFNAGHSSLWQLRSVEAQTLALPLHGRHLFSSLYLNELLYHLLDEHSAYPHLYHVYQQCLLGLSQAQAIEPWLRRFELTLLTELGYGLSLPHNWHAGQSYSYSFDHGFELAEPLSRAPTFSSEQVALLCEFDAENNSHVSAARGFCRYVLHCLLNGKALHSRQLFKQFQQTKGVELTL